MTKICEPIDDMLEFIKEFLVASRKNLSAWLGVISFVLGASAGVGVPLKLPPWTCFLFSSLAFASMAVQSEWKTYQARRAEMLPDMPLKDVLVRIVGSNNLLGNGNPSRVGKALLALREKALQGRIKIWGRLNVRVSDHELYPIREIDQNYWDGHEFDYMKWLSNPLGVTTPENPYGVAPEEALKVYTDLWLSRAQIDKIWPMPKNA